jgi:5'-3' exonuclease
MGLDGFTAFIKKKYPDVLINEHISKYAHQRVFMDVSSYIYKYICIYGTTSNKWINSVLYMFITLKKNKVHVIPVFDGKPPDEKKDEIDDRKEKREKLKDKIASLTDAITAWSNNELSDSQKDLLESTIKTLSEKQKTTKLKSLLFKTSDSKTLSKDDINDISNYIESLKRGQVYMTGKEMDKVKELLSVLGIPFLQAPDESETYCCFLCKKGLATAVISCDTDCFAHGCPETILNFEPSSGNITYVKLEELLGNMELSLEQFVDFSILIGCDYNKKNKLKNVGPVKALDLIKRYNRIDNIEGYDISNVNEVNIRKMFNKEYELVNVIKHKKINKDALENYIDQYNLNVNIDYILSSFKPKVTVVFEEE